MMSHDSIYTHQYYRELSRSSEVAARVIAASIVATLSPGTVVDVGCGSGDLLLELTKCGVSGLGMELSTVALETCRSRGIDCLQFDLTADALPDGIRADLAVSLEVAEHLPQDAAHNYLAVLTAIAPCLVFSAATPGQGGTSHLNEQPPEYWISRMNAHALSVDWEVTHRWRDTWREAGIAPWYHRNVLVFRRSS